MRNETEFKAEVLARYEKQKKAKKKRQRILTATVPALALVIILSAVFFSDSLGIIPNADGFDGAAMGTENDVAEPNILNGLIDLPKDTGTNNSPTDAAGAVDDESAAFINLSRTYSDKDTVEGFKALLGEFKVILKEGDTSFAATGPSIVLAFGEDVKKYILNEKAVYTSDMQSYFPIDKKKFEEITEFLRENPSN